MRLSPNGRRFIQKEEGLSLTAYPDPALPKVNGQWSPKQKWSIGYGHSGAAPGQRITLAEAERLFDEDVLKFETIVALEAPGGTQAQFDAMVALAYNIGTKGFSTSTVARLHRAGDHAGAAAAFAMWRMSAGAVNPVLVARRARETNVYRGLGYPGIDTGWSPGRQPTTAPSSPAAAASWPPLAVGMAAALVAFWALPKLALTRRALSLSASAA